MRNHVLITLVFTFLVGCLAMTDSFALGAVSTAQATPSLLSAAENGDTRGVRKMISGDAQLEARDGSGRTPLQHARERGYADIVRKLEKAGAQ